MIHCYMEVTAVTEAMGAMEEESMVEATEEESMVEATVEGNMEEATEGSMAEAMGGSMAEAMENNVSYNFQLIFFNLCKLPLKLSF